MEPGSSVADGEPDRSDHGERGLIRIRNHSDLFDHGGADQVKFQIASATGVLSLLSASDYENPTDTGGDNGYEVTVRASDGDPL